MIHHAYVPIWRRHPVLATAAVAVACWWLASGWYWALVVSGTAAAVVVVRRVHRDRARHHAGLRARADYEDGLTRRGDPRGVFGRYPPVPSGWFPDPVNRCALRYFDGTAWTGHTAMR